MFRLRSVNKLRCSIFPRFKISVAAGSVAVDDPNRKLCELYSVFSNQWVNKVDKQYEPVIYSSSDGSPLIELTHLDCDPPSVLAHSKQHLMPAKYCLLKRCTDADRYRELKTFELLRKGKIVGHIGYPGIGKSSLASFIHMQAWDNMFLDDGIKWLFVRFDGIVLKVTVEKEEKEKVPETGSANIVVTTAKKVVKVETFLGNCSFNEQLTAITQFQTDKEMCGEWKNRGDIVVIVEFTEGELEQKLPDLEYKGLGEYGLVFMATNSDIDFLVKPLIKGNDANLFIVDRMNDEQAEMCCQIMYEKDPETCWWAHDGNKLLDKHQAAEVIKQRIKVVGPTLRYITAPNKMYTARKNAMKTINEAKNALASLNNVSVFSMPKSTSLLVGLALKPHVTIPDWSEDYRVAAPEYFETHREAEVAPAHEWDSPCYHFTFLSETAKEQVLLAMEGDIEVEKKLEMLQTLNLSHILKEFVIKHALCMGQASPSGSINKLCNSSGWEFYRDPGSHVRITADDRLSSKEEEKLRQDLNMCTREERHSGDYVQLSVEKMEPFVLYSGSSTMAVGEYCFINKDKTRVYYVNVGRSDPTKHSFNTLHFETIANNHEIEIGQKFHGKCKLCLLYVTGWNHTDQYGIAVHKSMVVGMFGEKITTMKKFESSQQDDRERFQNMQDSRANKQDEYPPQQLDWLASVLDMRVIVRGRLEPSMQQKKLDEKQNEDKLKV